MSSPKVLAIVGPTATGKTDLGIHLAKKFNGEIIACDSRQVYKGLDIGTGKEPSKNLKVKSQKFDGYWQIDGIKIWMYDVMDPKNQYSVFDYVRNASAVLEGLLKREKLPIIVGGTGFYLKAFLEGLPNLGFPVDEKLRERLKKLSLAELQLELQKKNPDRWKKLNLSDSKNPRRLLRSIEIASMYGYVGKLKIKNEKLKIDALKIGLNAPRELLNSRINLRVNSWIKDGMIEEAKKLWQGGLTLERMRELGLEYGVLADLLEGKIEREDFIKTLQTRIRQYAKRQLTWFKRDRQILWFDISQVYLAKVEKEVSGWYNS